MVEYMPSNVQDLGFDPQYRKKKERKRSPRTGIQSVENPHILLSTHKGMHVTI